MSKPKLPDAPSSTYKVRFQDCDPFGHLYNARFLDYLINAREDHLADFYGLDVYQRQHITGTNWVVGRHRITYLAPAAMNETVLIETRLISFTAKHVLEEGIMWDQAGDVPKAVIWTDFHHYSLKEKRTVAHSDEDTALFHAILQRDPNLESVDFDKRVAQVRKGAAG